MTRVLKPIYLVALLGGIGALIYIFFMRHFSERQLVAYAPYGIYPLVFGAYGLLAERGLARVRRGQSASLAGAFASMSRFLGGAGVLLLAILLLPLFFLGWIKNSLVIALLGAAFWVGLLWFFFNAIFPSL